MKVWTGFNWLKQGPVADSCDHSNESSDSIKGRGTVEQLSDYQLRNKDSAPWS
jgi:hypothetical protein